MSRRDEHRAQLQALNRADWASYLRQHSGLPGPRGNLELAQAVADVADTAQIDDLLATDDEYSVVCGTIGLGRLLAEKADRKTERRLHTYAADSRWRVREGVAMALQRLGDADLPRMLDLVAAWVRDPHPLVQRAAIAGICEPRLLKAPQAAARAIETCEAATRSLAARPSDERKDDAVRSLRQALGYCWSVAVAADPAAGLPHFQALAATDDPDVAWIARENLKKSRLAKLL
jgi:HEAT repeat protein